MDSLFNRRASVGLMVRAPRPDMWGAVDWRLLPEDEGVCVRCAGDLPGDRAWLMGMDAGSGVETDAGRCPGCCLKGGWSDFAFAVRVVFGSLGTPEVVLRFEESVSRRLPLVNEGARTNEGGVPSTLFVGITPGPMLFRGARAAGFGGACAGNWLCRRVRMAMLAAGGGIDAASEVTVLPDTVEAPLGIRVVDWLKRRMKELLRAGRASLEGAPVNVCMLGVLVLVLAGTLALKLPGAGKSLRLGS